MDPVAFKIGGLTVYWYGILIVVAVLLGAWVSGIQARRRGQDPDHVWNALLVCLILGIIGARLYHVFSISRGGALGWPHYRQNPADIWKIWNGGLGLLGAIAGGVLGLVLYTKLTHLPVWIWLDIGGYGLLLGQAIGRWGNYVNQELYGPPTTLPWGIRIDPGRRIKPYNIMPLFPPDMGFHPVFLYEFLWCLIGFGLLWWGSSRYRKKLLDGDAFLLYLIWYPVGRFLIEFLRPDAWMFGPIAAAQVFSAIAAVAALLVLLIRRRRSAGNTVAVDADVDAPAPPEMAQEPQPDSEPESSQL